MFYNYRQNNSGGRFVQDSDLDMFVIIEADSLEEANKKAKSIGIYFGGVSMGFGCECCGDRWDEPWDDPSEYPEYYGKPIDVESEIFKTEWPLKDTGIKIHYKNGEVKTIKFVKE